MPSWRLKAKFAGAGAAVLAVLLLSISGYRARLSLEDEFLRAMSRNDWRSASTLFAGDTDDVQRSLELHPEIWGDSWRPVRSLRIWQSPGFHSEFIVSGRDHQDRLVHFDIGDRKPGQISLVIVDGKILLDLPGLPGRVSPHGPSLKSR